MTNKKKKRKPSQAKRIKGFTEKLAALIEVFLEDEVEEIITETLEEGIK